MHKEGGVTAPALISPPTQPEERQQLASAAVQVAVEGSSLRLGANGQEVRLPETLVRALQGLLLTLSEGEAVWIVPQTTLLTPQEAAKIIGLPRQAIQRAMETGYLPYERRGNRRRRQLPALLMYQAERVERRAALRELTRLSEEYGLYDR